MSQFRRFVAEGRLTRISVDRKLVLKEIEGAASDLEEAKDSLSRKKFKWAIVQGYYFMFHTARALLYSKGFREKSHYALFVALRELFGRGSPAEQTTPYMTPLNKGARDCSEHVSAVCCRGNCSHFVCVLFLHIV